MDPIDVSIVIVNWNRFEDVARNVRHLDRLRGRGPTFEVIVVDNGSTDGDAGRLAAFDSVRLVRLDANYGPSSARNRGIEAALGRYILFLDSDAYLSRKALAPLVRLMDGDPRVGIVGCRVMNGHTRKLDQWVYAQPASTHEKLGFESYSFSAAGALARASALREAGAFWEDLFIYNEEVDLSIRVIRAGYTVRYAPEATVLHFALPRGRGGPSSYWYYQSRNWIWIFYRYYPSPEALAEGPGVFRRLRRQGAAQPPARREPLRPAGGPATDRPDPRLSRQALAGGVGPAGVAQPEARAQHVARLGAGGAWRPGLITRIGGSYGFPTNRPGRYDAGRDPGGRPARGGGSMRPIKAALIGTGQIARQHLACLRELPGVEIAAVCDLSPGLAECAAERFGVPRWYTGHRAMIEEVRPDVVHVTTPPPSHFRLAMDALDGGAHVFVEKPATATLVELEALAARAAAGGLALVENYNYLFNAQVVRILELIDGGEFGGYVNADVAIHLDIKGKDSPFADPNLPHPCLSMAGGAIADFLPHLASLAHRFVGAHRAARSLWSKRAPSPLPSDEFRAIVDGQRGLATLSFSANSQPDAFWVRVQGERMHAAANLFETRLTINRVRGGPKPLRPSGTAWTRRRTSDAPPSGRSGASSAGARPHTRGSGTCSG